MFGWIFLAVVGALIAVAALYTARRAAGPVHRGQAEPPQLGLLEWAPAIGALILLFAGFVAVQFTVLFGGQRHVLKTAGLSYAEYARSGFWQLVVVTLLTLAVLGGVTRWASRERQVDRTVLRVLLGLLCALSVVIVVSALSRMYTYQKVYSFTGERIFVMAFELLLGAVFLHDPGGRHPVARRLDPGGDRRARRGACCSAWPCSTRRTTPPGATSPATSRPARSTPGTCARSPPTPPRP